MRFDLDVSQHQLSWEQLVARVDLAEQAGFTAAWLFDHFEPLYGDPDGPCLEAYTLMAALAARTERIRLGALVTGATYREPALLAAEAVTIDHVSGGRLELGIGAAWHEGEHRALGFPFPPTGQRIDRLEETIAVLKALWTQDAANFEGEHHVLRDATYHPRPVQRPHPPIWVGASGERRTIPLAARVADAWHTFGSGDELERRVAIFRREAQQAGRDPDALTVSTSLSLSKPWDAVHATIERRRDLGIDALVVSWPSEGQDHLETFIAEVLPQHAD